MMKRRLSVDETSVSKVQRLTHDADDAVVPYSSVWNPFIRLLSDHPDTWEPHFLLTDGSVLYVLGHTRQLLRRIQGVCPEDIVVTCADWKSTSSLVGVLMDDSVLLQNGPAVNLYRFNGDTLENTFALQPPPPFPVFPDLPVPQDERCAQAESVCSVNRDAFLVSNDTDFALQKYERPDAGAQWSLVHSDWFGMDNDASKLSDLCNIEGPRFCLAPYSRYDGCQPWIRGDWRAELFMDDESELRDEMHLEATNSVTNATAMFLDYDGLAAKHRAAPMLFPSDDRLFVVLIRDDVLYLSWPDIGGARPGLRVAITHGKGNLAVHPYQRGVVTFTQVDPATKSARLRFYQLLVPGLLTLRDCALFASAVYLRECRLGQAELNQLPRSLKDEVTLLNASLVLRSLNTS